jgi:HK97 family phage major capsid protein
LISATRTDASEVDADDIGRMWSHRYIGPQDYVWFVNASVLPQLYRMTIADGGYQGVYVPPGGLSASPYGSLLGRPVIETEYNPYLGTVGDILLASPSQYALITKGGIQSASSIHVAFVSDEECFRFVYRVDGQPIWASDVDAFDGTHTVSPFVALAATT